jgi:hypothetical protein
MTNLLRCSECAFLLGMRPGLRTIDGRCSACWNYSNRSSIDWGNRQNWLKNEITKVKKSKAATSFGSGTGYDCAVAVSGGKDSTAQVRFLFEKYGVNKALLIHLPKVFTRTAVGELNLSNLCAQFDVDLITVRPQIDRVKKAVRKDFFDSLHPGKSIGHDIYDIPKTICRQFGINLLFFGENGEYEYGGDKELSIFANNPEADGVSVIYLGAIEPYSAYGWYEYAKEIGFKDLSHTKEWYRQGQIEGFSEIDSFGHAVAVWTKFVKFGSQRVADITSQMVREGRLTRTQALQMTKDFDWVLDPKAGEDFRRTLDISVEDFNGAIRHHANDKVVTRDSLGNYRCLDLFDN